MAWLSHQTPRHPRAEPFPTLSRSHPKLPSFWSKTPRARKATASPAQNPYHFSRANFVATNWLSKRFKTSRTEVQLLPSSRLTVKRFFRAALAADI